jgi:hypothetical protein
MDTAIECNESAFRHDVNEEDIRCAFVTAKYDSWFEEGERGAGDKYLLIGFDLNGNLLEILYNDIDGESVNVFHAMPCRNIYLHLLESEE